MIQIRKPSWNFVRAEVTNLARCMFISTPISSGLLNSPTVESQSLKIRMPLSALRFSLTFFISAVSICGCFLVCHVFSRVTMTSSTQGKITGYLPQHWYGSGTSSFITCKKVRIRYKYVINLLINRWHCKQR